MSSKREKQKETVEEDFEAFVRHQLSSISDDLKEMKGTQVKIQSDIESLQSQIKKNESSISKLKESLDTKLEVLTGQLHEANTRINQIENDITKYAKEIDNTYKRLLSLERYINIMVKLKHYVSKATLISVYYSLIYPYLTYACTLWGNNYNAPLSQIVKLQNKAVRVINDVPLMESITPHHTSLYTCFISI